MMQHHAKTNDSSDFRGQIIHDEWAVLAGLRFILALIVVFHHVGDYVASGDTLHQFGRFGGMTAVIGFFIVSGYSMAHSLSSDPDPSRFLRRRLLRIYPLYIVGIALAVLPWLLFHSQSSNPMFAQFQCPTVSQIIQSLFFLQGVTMRDLPNNSVTWTLGVEWWLYMLSPLLMKLKLDHLKALCILSVGFYISHDYYSSLHYFQETYGLNIFTFAWAFIGGFAFYRYRTEFASYTALLLIAVSLICFSGAEYATQFAAVTIVFVIGVIHAAKRISLPMQWVERLQFLGNTSYALYLVHTPIFIILSLGYGCKNSLVLVACSLIMATLAYLLIDAPIRAHRQSVLGKVAMVSA